MRLTRAFFQTLRQAPADAELISHQYLLRAGFIRPLASGIFSYLPLARRAMDKIEAIIRQEMNAIGGQEITMPVVHPAELWQASGRWDAAYPELVHWQDRAKRDMTLAITHEEVVADLAKREISSYRQLPQLVYHIQTKFRDEPRARGGLIRVREFTMKDSYSLDIDEEGLDRQFRAHWQAYHNIFHRAGLNVMTVGADVGIMGGSQSLEFIVFTEKGEDTLLLCDQCGYAANREVATFRKPKPPQIEPAPLEKVATPDCKTIDDVASFLGVPTNQTAKAIFFVAEFAGQKRDELFVFAVTRGDMDVNETKLRQAIQAKSLRPAVEQEIRAIGAEPGYASPIGVQHCLVIVDDLVAATPNLVTGANDEGYHLRNVTSGRDFQPDVIADITAAAAGDPCPHCGHALQTERGVEVGNIFKLGTHFSQALGATFHAADGSLLPIVMGSYGIGVGRMLATVAETHNDDYGLIWPVSIAPFHVHLVVLPRKAPEAVETADWLYDELRAAGIEVFYDDRDDASPGVKFNDADLIGLPLRITVGARALKQGGVELKRRDQKERQLIPLDQVLATVRQQLDILQREVDALVIDVPYPGPD
ncbi:MAG: proline--tRNA ligase [Chloroflexota bacterium]|nr:proline--tRNA ligase [Chloroflexota bacterium]